MTMPENADPMSALREAANQRRVPQYGTVVVDPPWPMQARAPQVFADRGRKQPLKRLAMPYATMSVDAIADLRIPAGPDAHLYLWTTNAFLPVAFGIVRGWGFRYSTTLVWTKSPMGIGLGGAYGLATEFVVFARRGRPVVTRREGRNWWTWTRPYTNGTGHHSAKPEEFYALVEHVSPGPYLDMFARRPRLGWDVWGDEAPNPISLEGARHE